MIIITGAGSGIGDFLFRRYLTLGEDVIGTYHKTKCILKPSYKVDVTCGAEIDTFIEKAKINHRMQNIVLINCAGFNYNSMAHKADPLLWQKVINVNLVGTFNMIYWLLPVMREQKYGRIINLSSVVGHLGIPGTSAYSASKTALIGLTKAIAVENVHHGITVNNLNLGYFDIGMSRNDIPEALIESYTAKIPAKEFGNPEEIYKAVTYLIDATYVTGTSINIDGGLY